MTNIATRSNGARSQPATVVRCAIYTRKSTEEGLTSQIGHVTSLLEPITSHFQTVTSHAF
ncbi:hypothetical protein CA54_38540 [Symmachiella macrocystis]|uniref:Resolvase/invertase-type recombinase catalytic domain-containing protein n=1 Tax=Symmachiella macrocystis TaxID=2527985 RepID=A0A5C6B9I9_9PLAN|nr:hypothetical protein CA54_38540 [Symmachiella macrocystis]